MIKKIITLPIFLFCLTANAQQQDSDSTFIPKIRINATLLQFCIGPWGSGLKSNLSDESAFILNNSRHFLYNSNFDISVIFKDKLGVKVGLDFVTGDVNKKKIRNGFQDYVAGYSMEIPPDNNQTGESPFKNGYSFTLLDVGVQFFLKSSKKLKYYIPFCSYLYGTESVYPYVNVKYVVPLTNYAFNREYRFDIVKSGGIKAGINVRNYFSLSKQKGKHTSMYIQFCAELSYLKTIGLGYYVDTDEMGNQVQSTSTRFSQNNYYLQLGLAVGGDFHL